MGVEDPAEAAVSRAVNCIWDNAHISFDLICVSYSEKKRVGKENGRENDHRTLSVY